LFVVPVPGAEVTIVDGVTTAYPGVTTAYPAVTQ
jgi:hypothetical protein